MEQHTFLETSVIDTYIEFELKFGDGKTPLEQIKKDAKKFNYNLIKELKDNKQEYKKDCFHALF